MLDIGVKGGTEDMLLSALLFLDFGLVLAGFLDLGISTLLQQLVPAAGDVAGHF